MLFPRRFERLTAEEFTNGVHENAIAQRFSGEVIALLVGVAIALSSCTAQEIQQALDSNGSNESSDSSEPHQKELVRQTLGSLTLDDLAIMDGLAWPQTYPDMTGTFGLAHRSTATADIYRVAGSDAEVWVFYDGATAIGFEMR